MKETKKEIPFNYLNKIKGCRRGDNCWFYHNHKAEKISKILKCNPIKKFKDKLKVDKETKREHSENLMQVIIELLRLLIRENNIEVAKAKLSHVVIKAVVSTRRL